VCVAVRVAVCVVTCCSVLQCVAEWQYGMLGEMSLWGDAKVHLTLVWCNVVVCVAGCCSVLQCVAVCCCVLQCVAVWPEWRYGVFGKMLYCVVAQAFTSLVQYCIVCCNVLQCVAVRCRVAVSAQKWRNRTVAEHACSQM